MESLTVTFSQLRSANERVLQFASRYVQVKGLDMRSAVSEELGLWELDGIAFLEEFEKEFHVDFPERAYEYVIPPYPTGFLGKVFHGLAILVLAPFFFLAYPFLLMAGKRKESLAKRIRRSPKRLTLGDLALTLAAGRFVKREEVSLQVT